MKLSTIAAVASFLTLATTTPLGAKHHHNHKRVIVYETVTAQVIETEYASTTVFVTAGETPPASPAETNVVAVHTYTPKHRSKQAAKKKTSSAASQQSSFTPAPPAPTVAPPPATQQSSSTPVPPAPTVAPPPATEQSSSTPAPPPPPPATEQPSSTPAPPAPTVAPPPATQQPSSAPIAPSTPPPPPSSGGSSSAAECGEIGGTCSGDITFYDITEQDFGACGTHVNGLAEDIIALSAGMMGAQSNGNPFCGRKVAITVNGKTATGTVVDKCPGCSTQSIDLSHHLFDQLANEAVGRISDVKWHFTT